MKKKCLAIARKVMVWSLAASMLVATPLTASARGLNEVYKIEDNAGNLVPGDGSDNPRTGTVTSTATGTSVLGNESKIEGIVLSETDVNLTLNDKKDNSKKTLTVTILGTGITNMDKLQRSITWKSSDTAVVSLGNLAPENGGNTQSMELRANAGGTATVTVSLDDYKENIHFTATANVSVKEYATKLEFSEKFIPKKDNTSRLGYVKHSVDLNAALVKTPATANDEVTFAIASESAKGVAAIDKKGVLTYKKTGTIEIVAVGERVTSAPLKITIEAGNPANKVEIRKEGEATKAPKQTPDVSKPDEREIKVVAKLEVGKGTDKHWVEDANRSECTDEVKWSSNKPAIVDVKANGDKATLIPTGVGAAVITAQTSTGKKATLSVKVSATMTDIRITTVNQDIYSGQTLKLTADRYFGDGDAYKNFPGSDGVTWYLVDNANDKKIAQIKKDVFTAKTAVGDSPVVKVSVKSAKKYGKGRDAANTTPKAGDVLNITLKQADVQKILVQNVDLTDLAKVGYTPAKDNKKNGTVVINAGNGKTFKVTAYGSDGVTTTLPDGKTPLATTLNISSNKEKIATASRDDKGNAVVTAPADATKGAATITVSGTKCTNATRKTFGAIKATFKADVKIPAKTIQLAYKQKVVKATLVTKRGVTTTKAQNVTVNATLPKGTTTAPKSIKWEATVVHADKTPSTSITVAPGKNGVVKLAEGGYAAGDVIVVNAYIKDTLDTKVGATSTIRIPVVTPSRKVAIYDGTQDGNVLFKNSKNKANQKDLVVGNSLKLKPMVDIAAKGADNFVAPGTDAAADVTYSVNKKGIVTIVDGEVKGITPGTVKVTATTSDGKKSAALTITVTAPAAE